MKKGQRADYILVFTALFLVIFGLVALSSASSVMSQDIHGRNYYYLKHQLLLGFVLGLVGFCVCQKIDYNLWQKFSLPLLVVAILLLAAIFIPGLGVVRGGAKRWLNIGLGSIQPFEFLKLPLILYFSALLSKGRDTMEAMRKTIIPVLAIVSLISILVLLQPNMSALIMVFLIVSLLYFLAGIKWTYIAGAMGLAFVAFFVLIKTNAYRVKRLVVFLNPDTDPLGIGYQIRQALLAVGSGGVIGLGFGHSVQKWKYLPEVIGDSIFAVIAEEMGFIGAFIVIAAFVVLAWRGVVISKQAPNTFGFLVAGGITGWIFLQAFINIGAIIGILPMTGVPLPFISYGGSALATAMSSMGILVNVSKHLDSKK